MVKLLCMVFFALAIAAAAWAEEPVTNALPDPLAGPAPSAAPGASGTMQPGDVLGGLRPPAAAPAAAEPPRELRRPGPGAVDPGGPRRRMSAERREWLRERLARMTPEQRAMVLERLRERRAQRQSAVPY